MTYVFRSGYRCNVSAKVAGERIAEIEAANDGHLTPSCVVDDSRPEEAPLHPCFEWDDEVAAEKYRVEEARRLIRNVYIEVENEEGRETPVLHHVHVTLPDVGPCYVTTARAMSEDDLREQVVSDALNAFEALGRRYQHIQEIEPILTAVERIRAKRKKVKRAPGLAAIAS
jgi:hypothetical protein